MYSPQPQSEGVGVSRGASHGPGSLVPHQVYTRTHFNLPSSRRPTPGLPPRRKRQGGPRYVGLVYCVEAVRDGQLYACTRRRAIRTALRKIRTDARGRRADLIAFVSHSARSSRAVASFALLRGPRSDVPHEARARKEREGAQKAPQLGLDLPHFAPPSLAFREVLSLFDLLRAVSGVPLARKREAIVFSPTPYLFAHSRSVRVSPLNV